MSRVDRPRVVATLATACLVLGIWSSSCSGGSGDGPTASPSPPGLQPGHSFVIGRVEGFRWANAGTYSYRVQYTYRNPSSNIATYSLLDVAAFGPSGETLPGYSSIDVGRATLVDPGASSSLASISIGGGPDSVAHVFAERVRLRIQVDEGGKRGVLTAEGPVSHPPQTARLLEFATSPVEAADSVAPLPVPQVHMGQPVTVRWTVVDGGSRVVLETSIGASGRAPDQVVEAVGSRTFIVARTGLQSITLHVDNLIRKTLWLHLVP